MNEIYYEQRKSGIPLEEILNNQACAQVEYVETCTEQLHPSCTGFAQSQLRLWAQTAEQLWKDETPECFKKYF